MTDENDPPPISDETYERVMVVLEEAWLKMKLRDLRALRQGEVDGNSASPSA